MNNKIKTLIQQKIWLFSAKERLVTFTMLVSIELHKLCEMQSIHQN